MGMSGCVIGGPVRPRSRDYCPNGRHPEAPSTPPLSGALLTCEPISRTHQISS